MIDIAKNIESFLAAVITKELTRQNIVITFNSYFTLLGN